MPCRDLRLSGRWLLEALLQLTAPVVIDLRRLPAAASARIARGIRSVWKTTGEHSEQIKIFSGVFVAAFVLWEYYGRVQENRVGRALSYVAAHHSNEKMIARIESRLFWHEPERLAILKNLDKVLEEIKGSERPDILDELAHAKDGYANPAPMSLQGVDAGQNAGLSSSYLGQLNADRAFGAKLHTLQNFYHAVANCTLSGVCDEETMCRAFFPDVFSFRSTYRPYFDSWAAAWYVNKGILIDDFLQVCDQPAYVNY